MTRVPMRRLKAGLVGGLLAGVMLAVLFFFHDLGQGAPLRTPAFLWGAVFAQGEANPTVGNILGYTIIHFIAWAGLGAAAAALMHYVGLPRNLFIGLAYGLSTSSFLFYLGLIRAPDSLVIAAPGWPVVFFGNALAGVVMFTYMHWVSTEPGVTGLMEFLRTHSTTRQGVVAGLAGATAVAIWFLIIDSIMREPFFTPAALAMVLFRGGTGAGGVEITMGAVLGYTVAHYAFFVFFGIVLSALTDQVSRFPPLVFGVLILFVAFEVFFIAIVAVLGGWVLEELAWWSILLGNGFAALVMGLYIWRVHPELLGRLTEGNIWGE